VLLWRGEQGTGGVESRVAVVGEVVGGEDGHCDVRGDAAVVEGLPVAGEEFLVGKAEGDAVGQDPVEDVGEDALGRQADPGRPGVRPIMAWV
jgi:hypothetical protein